MRCFNFEVQACASYTGKDEKKFRIMPHQKCLVVDVLFKMCENRLDDSEHGVQRQTKNTGKYSVF